MEKSRVLTDPICLIVILLFFNVLLTAAEGKHTQPKSIKVSLRAKWSSTPLLLEAGELLANEQKDLYWEFVKKWTESDHHLASSKECFQQILDYGSYFLKDKLLSFFHFSLVLRSASPKLVLYRQLAQESLLSNPLFHKSEKNLSNFDSSIISASNPDLGRWSISENPPSPKGRCCWVDVGSSILYDITELSTWIADSQELLKNTPEMEIYDFDHIYPISNRTGYRAILYAALGTKCFSAFHSALAAAAEKGKLQYILRPVLPSGCESDAEYCASVGSGSILNLSGYGVELALKNMEYKAIDDSVVKKGIVLEDPRTEDLTQEVRGFIFSRLLERKPAITADLMTFRDVLLSSTISETLDVWELKDLGHQTAQRIVQASDPFHAMQEINQNFPAVVSSLSRTKLDESIKDEIVANQRMVPPGKCLMAINGALINIESIDLFSLMAVVHGELSLADRIAAFKVPPKDIKALLYTTDSLEQTSFRLDFRSSHVHYLNNLEEDAAYRRWRSNINELLMPIFPGQFYYIRKNLFHAVYVLDPSSMRGLKVIDVIMYMYNNKVPMRFGIILFSSRLAKVFEENGDDSLKCSKSGEEKQQKYNDTAISIISLFYYIKEKYDTKTAFKFLYNLHSLWGVTKPHDDDLVELSYVEDAFLETTRAKGDSSPQEISLKLESESNIKDKACQSTVTVFKLGLSEIQPCLLMNGLVYGNIQAQEAALQAMNEELMRIQEGVYYRQIDSYTDILEKFLSENGHPRYNPYIINDGRDDQKFVSLAEWILRNNSVFTNLKYLHSPETSDDLKPVTHLLAVDLTSRGGLNLLLQGVRYLLDGSKRSRIAILYNVNDGFSILEDSPTTLLLKVIELSFSLGQNSKILPFLNDLLSWYEVNYLAGVDERKFDARMFVDDVYKLSEANDLKTERLKSALAEQSFSSLKIYLEKVSNFLSLEFGLMPGENAIITNGRVVLQNEHRFIRDDFKLLEAVEYERRIKPIVSVIEQVEWNGMDPDDLTSEFLSNALLGISSAMAIRSRSSDKAHFEILNAEHSAIIKEVENSFLHIDAVIDPLSSTGQKLAPLLRLLVKWFQPSARIVLNPVTSLADLPLKNFYRYVVPSEADIISDASSFDGPIAWFSNMPLSKTLTMNLDVPEPWLVEPVIAIHDLDNILLENLGVERTLAAVFELEALVLTGHCSEKDHDPPRGLQLILGTKKDPHMVDTLVMANLGYWQLKASPGIWSLSLAPGRSSELYTLEGPKEGTEEGPMTKKIVIDSFDPKSVHLQVVRKRGKENEKLLRDADGTSSDDLPKEEKKGWNNGFLKWASGLINSEEKQLPKNLKNSDVYDMNGRHGETIHIFSIASGHLYERFLKIMILSVLKNTNRPLKFWFIKNYLSPQFKDVIPHMAKKYGFEYELITYKWPTWLHKQTEKQRIIWAYKILFLDVIFPLSLKKVIFVDADQIVRADMGELYDMDIKGKPLAYTPFCDNNKEMDGYRFWKQGFWKDHLRGKPYHISALYVVDLEKFRQLAAGDTLRVFYETLSKDRNSLSNLDQDLPNYAQHTVPIFSLPQEWLWCESWCGNATKSKSKTIDLCNNPMTKEPKLQGARRIVAEWPSLDEEVRKFTATILGEEIEENMQDNETQNQLLKDSEEKQDLESLAEL